VMQNFVIESCDPDERQIFVDVFAAEDKPRAITEWELQRGSYAVLCNCLLLPDYLDAVEAELIQLAKIPAECATLGWDVQLGDESCG